MADKKPPRFEPVEGRPPDADAEPRPDPKAEPAPVRPKVLPSDPDPS